MKLTQLSRAISPLLVLLAVLAAWTFSPLARAQINPAVMPLAGPLSKQSVSRMLLTAAVRGDKRIIAVGDRGYIIFSDDNGERWERATTPLNLPLLTAVRFADANSAWAVGHDSVILKSSDQGKTWEKAFSAAKDQRPMMDVLFLNASTGFAIGAYGAFFETGDGGKQWTARKVFTPAPTPAPTKAPPGRADKNALAADADADAKGGDEDRHLNAMLNLGDGKLLIVGEAGTLLKSVDSGQTWVSVTSPYKGSFFGGIVTGDGGVVIYGLRGNVYRADADLKEWTQVQTNTKASFMGSTTLADGAIALVGLSGTLMVSRDQGKTFAVQKTGTTKAMSAVLTTGANGLLLFGEAGVRALALGGAPPATPPPSAK